MKERTTEDGPLVLLDEGEMESIDRVKKLLKTKAVANFQPLNRAAWLYFLLLAEAVEILDSLQAAQNYGSGAPLPLSVACALKAEAVALGSPDPDCYGRCAEAAQP